MSNMQVVKLIEPKGWMCEPQVKRVMDALNADHDAPMALFVGGCVRNAVLDLPVFDIDIATKHTPERVIALFDGSDIKIIPTGIDHGTVTAVFQSFNFEITTLRSDIKTDGRHAEVQFSACWISDAQRRDFTMNALFMDQGGSIFDPLECGLDDLDARNVVFVGEPDQRIAEDYLRILRFFRFFAYYGAGEPDARALVACAKAADKIKTLSKERITQEFFKIISASSPFDVLSLMFNNNILSDFYFGDDALTLLRDVCVMQNKYKRDEFFAARMMSFLNCDLSNLDKTDPYLLFPKVVLKDMRAIGQVTALGDLSKEHLIKEAMYRYGRHAAGQAFIIQLAQNRIGESQAAALLDIIDNWDIPTFHVSGEDLMREGFKQGPELGVELSRREQDWIDAGFPQGS